jgi:hypothetical protein
VGSAGRTDASLEDLLQQARDATPATRIDYRNPIAAHGLAAVEVMRDWLGDPKLGAFAVRVLRRVADSPARQEAIAALQAGRPRATSEAVRRDIDEALTALGVRAAPAPPAAPTDPYAVEPVPSRAGSGWPGFQAHEFGRVAGTRWRSRDGEASLAPILVTALRHQHPHFMSYPVERSPMLHLAVKERYWDPEDRTTGWRAAKLVVYALGPTSEDPDAPAEVVGGLYVEKTDGTEPYGPLDDRWDWTWFVPSLADADFQARLSAAMQRHGMAIGDYRGQWFGIANEVGFVARFEGPELVLHDHEGDEIDRGWDAVRSRLEHLPPAGWHNLHLYRTWPAQEAIGAGREFAFSQLLPALTDLARVYLHIVAPALPTGRRGYRILESFSLPDGRQAIRYEVTAHALPGHFNVPRDVMDRLGIETDGAVELVVDGEGVHFEGAISLASGTEVYYRASDPSTHGLERIGSYARLTVTVSRPPGKAR